jgi:3-oxoacyl-[acyl-carrier-protein] synthase III
MPGLRIVGSGRYLPGRPYTNSDLARVMETSDEWIRQRTGIHQRHYCPEGLGVSDLAVEASKLALESAGLGASDIDYILFNTMTPDHLFPGSGPLLGAKLGIPGVPALDLRAQCAAMVFSFQVAESLLLSGAAKRILLVGAEAHAGFMPWVDWDVLDGTSDRKPSEENWVRATSHRSLAIIFGDGAGALVLEKSEDPGVGILSCDVHSDGNLTDELLIPLGFRTRPYVTHELVDADKMIPSMEGREVFKQAVSKLPISIRAACAAAGVTLDDVEWFLGHQANDRINNLVRDRLELPKEKVPSNIALYGNTSTATLPILIDEMRRDGRLTPGQLVCMFALGAGLHWGSMVLRV